MPIIGDAESANDTFAEQTANAEAAIGAVKMGICDEERVASAATVTARLWP